MSDPFAGPELEELSMQELWSWQRKLEAELKHVYVEKMEELVFARDLQLQQQDLETHIRECEVRQQERQETRERPLAVLETDHAALLKMMEVTAAEERAAAHKLVISETTRRSLRLKLSQTQQELLALQHAHQETDAAARDASQEERLKVVSKTMELLGRSLSEAERDHLQLEAALKERELATAELQKCVTNVEALMADETSELRGLTARHHSLEMDLQRILQHQAELNDVMRDLFTKKSTLLEQLQKAPECGDEVQEAIQVLLDQNTGMEEDVQEIAGCSLTEIQQVTERWAREGTAMVQQPGDIALMVRIVKKLIPEQVTPSQAKLWELKPAATLPAPPALSQEELQPSARTLFPLDYQEERQDQPTPISQAPAPASDAVECTPAQISEPLYTLTEPTTSPAPQTSEPSSPDKSRKPVGLFGRRWGVLGNIVRVGAAPLARTVGGVKGFIGNVISHGQPNPAAEVVVQQSVRSEATDGARVPTGPTPMTPRAFISHPLMSPRLVSQAPLGDLASPRRAGEVAFRYLQSPREGHQDGDLPSPRITPRGDLPSPRITPRGDLPSPRHTPRGDLPSPRHTPRGELASPRAGHPSPRSAPSPHTTPRATLPSPRSLEAVTNSNMDLQNNREMEVALQNVWGIASLATIDEGAEEVPDEEEEVADEEEVQDEEEVALRAPSVVPGYGCAGATATTLLPLEPLRAPSPTELAAPAELSSEADEGVHPAAAFGSPTPPRLSTAVPCADGEASAGAGVSPEETVISPTTNPSPHSIPSPSFNLDLSSITGVFAEEADERAQMLELGWSPLQTPTASRSPLRTPPLTPLSDLSRCSSDAQSQLPDSLASSVREQKESRSSKETAHADVTESPRGSVHRELGLDNQRISALHPAQAIDANAPEWPKPDDPPPSLEDVLEETHTPTANSLPGSTEMTMRVPDSVSSPTLAEPTQVELSNLHSESDGVTPGLTIVDVGAHTCEAAKLETGVDGQSEVETVATSDMERKAANQEVSEVASKAGSTVVSREGSEDGSAPSSRAGTPAPTSPNQSPTRPTSAEQPTMQAPVTLTTLSASATSPPDLVLTEPEQGLEGPTQPLAVLNDSGPGPTPTSSNTIPASSPADVGTAQLGELPASVDELDLTTVNDSLDMIETSSSAMVKNASPEALAAAGGASSSTGEVWAVEAQNVPVESGRESSSAADDGQTLTAQAPSRSADSEVASASHPTMQGGSRSPREGESIDSANEPLSAAASPNSSLFSTPIGSPDPKPLGGATQVSSVPKTLSPLGNVSGRVAKDSSCPSPAPAAAQPLAEEVEASSPAPMADMPTNLHSPLSCASRLSSSSDSISYVVRTNPLSLDEAENPSSTQVRHGNVDKQGPRALNFSQHHSPDRDANTEVSPCMRKTFVFLAGMDVSMREEDKARIASLDLASLRAHNQKVVDDDSRSIITSRSIGIASEEMNVMTNRSLGVAIHEMGNGNNKAVERNYPDNKESLASSVQALKTSNNTIDSGSPESFKEHETPAPNPTTRMQGDQKISVMPAADADPELVDPFIKSAEASESSPTRKKRGFFSCLC
mmetsp:Transcript_22223/g.42404  ORF Transcript_22223/g.42404 Transcript_22223/m.42404 type:complete len:1565 (-) Transcript_22223:334-5028(-)